MLTWRTATADAYRASRFDLLLKAEGLKPLAYLDTVEIPTIGLGFNLRANMHQVAQAILGDDWSHKIERRLSDAVDQTYEKGQDAKLLKNLDRVLHNFAGDDQDFPQSFAMSNDQMQTVLDEIDGSYEAKINRWLAGIPESEERAVLFSLAYNTKDGAKSLLGAALRNAINDGDRAEAWYEIRYNSNGTNDAGLANRRYVEAHRFSLFDGTGVVSGDEAIQVAQIYTAHRDRILDYEAKYDAKTAGATKGEAGIADILSEYAPIIAVIQAANAVPADLKFEEVQVTFGKIVDLHGDGTGHDTAKNEADLLIGDNRANLLDGGQGDDALVGRGGADTLKGGAGNDWINGGNDDDTLDGGEGADTMIGGSGDDSYYVDNVNDILVEKANGGTDQIFSSITWRLAKNFENLTLTGTSNINGTGNAEQNFITGNAGNNVLRGGGGVNDFLDGGGGNDVLHMIDQSIIMNGGSGADRFVINDMHASGLNPIGAMIDFVSHQDKVDTTSFGHLQFVETLDGTPVGMTRAQFDAIVSTKEYIELDSTMTNSVVHVVHGGSDYVVVSLAGTIAQADIILA